MSTDANQTTVSGVAFRDSEGHFYFLPLEMLQQGRVPDEQVAAFEQMLKQQAEVQGFYLGRGAPLPPAKPPVTPQTGGGAATNILWGDYFLPVSLEKNFYSRFIGL